MQSLSVKTTVDVPMDWSQLSIEVLCPLCDYNLRGLTEPRCPECGFSFRWDELLTALRDRHPYLFEHQTRRNIWSFFKTWWGDSRPRRFWKQLNPAHPVNLFRLIIYWLAASSIVFAGLLLPIIDATIRTEQTSLTFLSYWKQSVPGGSYIYVGAPLYVHGTITTRPPIPAAIINAQFPPIWSRAFVDKVWNNVRPDILITSIAVFLSWPWLTFLSLLIFQMSMKRAKVKPSHVLRCTVYGCDFALLFPIILFPLHTFGFTPSIPLFSMLFCATFALYRISIAYHFYLRFDHPFLTVLSSQIIVFLTVSAVVLNI